MLLPSIVPVPLCRLLMYADSALTCLDQHSSTTLLNCGPRWLVEEVELGFGAGGLLVSFELTSSVHTVQCAPSSGPSRGTVTSTASNVMFYSTTTHLVSDRYTQCLLLFGSNPSIHLLWLSYPTLSQPLCELSLNIPTQVHCSGWTSS